MEVFDGASWSPAPSMLMKLDDVAADTFRNEIYVVGGWGDAPGPAAHPGYPMVRNVQIFDGTKWRFGPLIKFGRCGHGMAVLNDKLYVIGGYGNGIDNMDSVEVFDGNEWTAGPSLPVGRGALKTQTFQGKIYAIGGHTYPSKGDAVSTMDIFDGSSWTPGPSMSVARYSMAAVVWLNKIYVFGGRPSANYSAQHNASVLDAVESFDGTGWKLEAPLSLGRACLAAQVIHDKNSLDKVLVIGGDTPVMSFSSRLGGNSSNTATCEVYGQ